MNNEDDEIGQWVKISNERGHASGSAHNDNVLPGSKGIVERTKVRDWGESLFEIFNRSVQNIREGGDPPDVICDINGKETSVECVELVDGELIGKLKAANKKVGARKYTSSAGDGFRLAQWNCERFCKRLFEAIHDKDEKYQSSGQSFGILLVYTSENWLLPDDVERWIKRFEIGEISSFAEIHLLLDYSPGRKPNFPIFRIF